MELLLSPLEMNVASNLPMTSLDYMNGFVLWGNLRFDITITILVYILKMNSFGRNGATPKVPLKRSV